MLDSLITLPPLSSSMGFTTPYLYFGNIIFLAKLYLYFITTGTNRLHVCHSIGILNMNLC